MATGSITSLGIGSSLDLQGMLDTQRAADQTILDLKKGEIEAQTAVKVQLNSVLNQLLSMKSNALNLSLGSNYLYRSVAVSDTDLVSASALDGTRTGSHRVVTSRLASASSYISQGASSAHASVYVPTAQESVKGYEDTQVVLAAGETLEIQYGPEDDPAIFTISGPEGGMTAAQLVAAVNSDPANQDAGGSPLVTASADTDGEGKTRIRIEAASGENGEDHRVRVSGAEAGFAPPVSALSFKTGEDGEVYSISVPAETTLKGLAQRINEDENNPGVTAKLIDTGTGDNPWQLVLTSDASGEESRVIMVSGPPDLTLTEKNGSGYAMTGETAISFDSPVVVDNANNTIVFQEDGGDGYGTDLVARIEAGSYETPKALAQAVETALENESGQNGSGRDYHVRIDADTGKMTIREAGTLEGLTMGWGRGETTAAGLLGFSQTQEITPAGSSLNALVMVDDIAYQRQDNQNISDILDGVTFSLYAIGSSTLTVNASTTMIETEMTSLVETYNALVAEIDENDDYDEETGTWGTLSRSATARSLEQSFQRLFSTRINTNGSLTSLMDLGVEINRDGTITLDAETLNRQLTQNFEDVRALFTGSGSGRGLADIMNDEISEYALSGGYLNNEIDAVDDTIARLDSNYKTQLAALDKKYETMAAEYAALDAYLAEIESTRSYLDQMLSSDED